MSLTLEEVKELLAKRLDEVTLLEVLEISSEDLVEAFSDKIEEKMELLERELEDWEEPSLDGLDN